MDAMLHSDVGFGAQSMMTLNGSTDPTATSSHLVVFTLDDQHFALPLSVVERIVHIVDISPVPDAPVMVLGVINVQGRLLPVIDMRKRLRLPARDVELSDRLIITHTATRAVALRVDAVSGAVALSGQDIIASETILPGMGDGQGMVKLADGMALLIGNLDAFLSLEDVAVLDNARIKSTT
jgi:purine-binding chemotaxis protein CheW